MALKPGETPATNYHARVAKQLLTDAEYADRPIAQHRLLQAQIEATLALVHEQRTANLIAWRQTMSATDEVGLQVGMEIAERLALPDQIE
jgi:hypothetical protein